MSPYPFIFKLVVGAIFHQPLSVRDAPGGSQNALAPSVEIVRIDPADGIMLEEGQFIALIEARFTPLRKLDPVLDRGAFIVNGTFVASWRPFVVPET